MVARQARGDGAWAHSGAVKRSLHNLSVPRKALIGRDDELANIRELVMSDVGRLVTIVGAGGSGKTHLALYAAASLVDAFPNGVFMVPLARIRDPLLVPYAIAHALDVRERPGQSLLDGLGAHL